MLLLAFTLTFTASFRQILDLTAGDDRIYQAGCLREAASIPLGVIHVRHLTGTSRPLLQVAAQPIGSAARSMYTCVRRLAPIS